MNKIPFNVALVDKNGRKCFVRFRMSEPTVNTIYPLRGEVMRKGGEWGSSCWKLHDEDIVGIWDDKVMTEEDKVTLFTAWLRGVEIESRHKPTRGPWKPIRTPTWDFECWEYRIKELGYDNR